MPTGDSETMRCSICETVMPASAAACRRRRSMILGANQAPTPTPTASASNGTTAVSSADTTVTRKSYASGERHPSSVRPIRYMSQSQAQVFGSRSLSVSPEGLFRSLAGDRGCSRGGGRGVQIGAAGDERREVGVQVVAQRDAGGDVQPDDVLVGHPVQVLDQGTQRV